MAAYKFKVIVKASDRIFSLRFHPEHDEELSLRWHMQEGLTKFSSDEFDVEVTGDFDFKLIIGARQSTTYSYWIKIKSGPTWIDLDTDRGILSNSNKATVEKSLPISSTFRTLRPIV
jgi:hypothetical protein